MKKVLLSIALALAAYFSLHAGLPTSTTPSSLVANHNDNAFENAFTNHVSNLQLAGRGTVVKVLPDDNSGIRHQRFIIRLDSGLSLLVAHNIDLAQRIDSLRKGDTVEFYGEYEWSSKGGVMHWTHHDPHGRHPTGWIKHNGQTYQ